MRIALTFVSSGTGLDICVVLHNDTPSSKQIIVQCIDIYVSHFGLNYLNCATAPLEMATNNYATMRRLETCNYMEMGGAVMCNCNFEVMRGFRERLPNQDIELYEKLWRQGWKMYSNV